MVGQTKRTNVEAGPTEAKRIAGVLKADAYRETVNLGLTSG